MAHFIPPLPLNVPSPRGTAADFNLSPFKELLKEIVPPLLRERGKEKNKFSKNKLPSNKCWLGAGSQHLGYLEFGLKIYIDKVLVGVLKYRTVVLYNRTGDKICLYQLEGKKY